jgi:hypothetical protein
MIPLLECVSLCCWVDGNNDIQGCFGVLLIVSKDSIIYHLPRANNPRHSHSSLRKSTSQPSCAISLISPFLLEQIPPIKAVIFLINSQFQRIQASRYFFIQTNPLDSIRFVSFTSHKTHYLISIHNISL